jgi:branched-chain amino acid transport system permease protein
MSVMRLPSGVYHETYVQDHAWWQTRFVWVRMIILLLILFVGIPALGNLYIVSVANIVGYTILSALGVQLLIGFAGQVTLGHAAFIAVGAYTSAIAMLQFNLPYPVSLVLAALFAGVWSVLFGLPSARVKGFYLIMTTMAAQFVTVDFVIAQYVSRIGERGHYFSLPPGTVTIGPWVIDSEMSSYYLMLVLVVFSILAVGNLMRTRIGRAWIAIRDNDIAAEVLGVNIVRYKLLAYFVAGVLAGIAGAFWTTSLYFVSPEHFQWGWSLWLVGVILIGGVGSIYGVIYGALFMTLVPEALKALLFLLTQSPQMVALFPFIPQLLDKFLFVKEASFGLAIVLFLLFEPKGLAYRWWQIKNYIHLWPFSY